MMIGEARWTPRTRRHPPDRLRGNKGAVIVLPPLDETGSLPPGVHPATLEEIEERFGRGSELRRVQTESVLGWSP